MARFLYRILRVANLVGRVDETKLRAAMRSPSMVETITRLAELDKPLSYSLPFTGDSMAPLFNAPRAGATPEVRDTLVIRALNPKPQSFLNRVHVDDVVVIQDPDDARRKYVRRIAGLEGAEMVSDAPGDPPFRIPADHCWVVRDNPAVETAPDSRVFGPLNLEKIIGRVIYAIRSATDHGRVTNSAYGMATDEIVLRQEPVSPHIDAHAQRARSEAHTVQKETSEPKDGE